MKYKSICIVGVDGSGKSSTIDLIRKQLGEDRIVVQYMGAKEWESPVAQKYIDTTRSPNCSKLRHELMKLYAHIYDMYYRVYKHKDSSKIVLFDRYAYEQALFRKANVKDLYSAIVAITYYWFLLLLFPKPCYTIYLVCPIDVSLSRKSDIVTQKEIEGLKKNKKLLDEFYRNKKNVLVIDTSKEKQETIVSNILDIVESKL